MQPKSERRKSNKGRKLYIMLLKEQVLYEKHSFLIRSGFSSTRVMTKQLILEQLAQCPEHGEFIHHKSLAGFTK